VKNKPNSQPIGEPFFAVVHSLFESDKYRALPPLAVVILHLLMYRHDRREDNGEISLGCREAADWYDVNHVTAWRAFQRLQKDGFITEVNKGHLVPIAGRHNISTTWRLNIRPFAPMGNSNKKSDHNAHKRTQPIRVSDRMVRGSALRP
jgi:hypothetical protein